MVLSSLHFIFIFLPAAFFLYAVLPFSWWRNLILLSASMVFYAWGEPVHILLLIGMILFNWLAGLLVHKLASFEKKRASKLAAILSVIINLTPLLFFKLDAVTEISFIEKIGLGGLPSVDSFPLGLSFYTFSAVAYIIDVYQQEIQADGNIFRMANFLGMFPKILQGPITRYQDVGESLQLTRINIDGVSAGLRRFIVGLAKKVLIADYLARVTGKVFGLETTDLSAGLAWYGLAAFSLQLYLDFSGYTDMAIGLGRMFGFTLPENFNFPYMSRSVSDFWRRWHMSLVNWLRTYIFMPLEIARRKSRHFRLQSNILIIFLLTGLWHGFAWNFIIWGLYSGIILILEASFLSRWLKKIPVIFQHVYSLVLVAFGWVFFNLSDPGCWSGFFRALFGFNRPEKAYSLRSLNILAFLPLLVVGAAVSTPLVKNAYLRLTEKSAVFQIIADVLLLGLLVLSVGVLLASGYQAFLYSEF